MAFSSSSFSFITRFDSSSILESPTPQPSELSDKEFNIFHFIDRELFTRLVSTLGHDPAESAQVIAFFLWLESQSTSFLIDCLRKFPDDLLNALYDETLLCLRSAETDVFRYSEEDDRRIPMLQSLIKKEISLKFFHENRVTVLCGVGRIIQDVCLKAFEDLIEKTLVEINGSILHPSPTKTSVLSAAAMAEGNGLHSSSDQSNSNSNSNPVPVVPVPSHTFKVGDVTIPVFNQISPEQTNVVTPIMLSLDPNYFDAHRRVLHGQPAEFLTRIDMRHPIGRNGEEVLLEEKGSSLDFVQVTSYM